MKDGAEGHDAEPVSTGDDVPDVQFEMLAVASDDEFLGVHSPAPPSGSPKEQPPSAWEVADTLRDEPQEKVDATAVDIRDALNSGNPVIVCNAAPTNLKELVPQMNAGAELLAEVAGQPVLEGTKELDALWQTGLLRGIFAYAGPFDLESPSAAAGLRATFRKGVVTTEGLRVPHGMMGRDGVQPPVVVIGAGPRVILEAAVRHISPGLGIDAQSISYCFVDKPGRVARIGLLVALPKRIVTKDIWPGIEGTAAWPEVEAIMSRPHVPAHVRDERDDYDVGSLVA